MTGADELAALLVAAYGDPAARLDRLVGIDEVDPYGVAGAVAAGLTSLGAGPAVGYKLSFTVADPPAEGLAVAPAYGTLLESQVLGDGAEVPVEGEPLVETEVVVRARSDLSPGQALEEIAARVDLAAGLEVPVSRFRSWWPDGEAPRISRAEFIADGCLARYLVVSPTWQPAEHVAVDRVGVRLECPTGEAVVGRAMAVMGHPLRAVSWLVDQLGALPAGTLVATGTMTTPVRATAGTYSASFDALGEVQVTFT